MIDHLDILYMENFLTDEECNKLIDLYNISPTQDFSEGIWAGRAKWLNYPEDIKRKLILGETRAAEKFFKKMFMQDNLHVMIWNEGHEMPPHSDYGHDDEYAHRHYASIVYLNDDYEGGDLYMPELGLTIKPKKGLYVCFRGGEILHGVTKITKGTRYTAICWFTEI